MGADAQQAVDRLPSDAAALLDLGSSPDMGACPAPDAGFAFVGRVDLSRVYYKFSNGTVKEGCSVAPRFWAGGVFRSAGTIIVSGGSKPIVIPPESDGTYKAFIGESTLWKGGETLTVTASGDVLPPMKASVVVPTQVRFTAPPPGDGANITVPLKNDFKMAWTGSSSGLLYPSLFNSMVQVGNSVLPALGQGVITATELAKIAPGPGVWLVQQIQFGGASGCDWKLELVATTNPIMLDDTKADRTATFQ